MIGASAIAFMAYEELIFNEQPPQFAGQMVAPPQQDGGQSF